MVLDAGQSADRAGDERWMRTALDMARRSYLAGEPPIGACLVQDAQVLACAHNAVIAELDVTAHAEMQAIREACRRLRRLELPGTRLFVTVEPCPMCLSACHYAGVRDIVYGASLEDIHRVTGDELLVSPAHLLGDNRLAMEITGGVLGNECRALLEEWAASR